MRLFLGTTVPIDLAGRVNEQIVPVLASMIWKPAPLEQWHVTALFIGERGEASLPIIRDAARHLASITAPIKLSEGRLVTMPKDEPSMLWIRFRPSPQLTALHLELAARTGTEPSVYRPYWPHITLARARKRHVQPVVEEPTAVLMDSITLGDITLFQSTVGSEGPVHTPLETWAFTGTDPVDHAAVG